VLSFCGKKGKTHTTRPIEVGSAPIQSTAVMHECWNVTGEGWRHRSDAVREDDQCDGPASWITGRSRNSRRRRTRSACAFFRVHPDPVRLKPLCLALFAMNRSTALLVRFNAVELCSRTFHSLRWQQPDCGFRCGLCPVRIRVGWWPTLSQRRNWTDRGPSGPLFLCRRRQGGANANAFSDSEKRDPPVFLRCRTSI
jgi:hypothetical protein